MATETITTTYEQRRFIAAVRAVGPSSSPQEIQATIALLQNDRKAQMGRLYLARQAQLCGTHLADYYIPRFLSESWQPRAYKGAAFFREWPEPHSEVVKRRVNAQRSVLEGAVNASIQYHPGGRATVEEVWPEALEPSFNAVTVVPPELIPLDRDQQETLHAGFKRFQSIANMLNETSTRLREAVTTFDNQYAVVQIFRGRHRSLLGTTLSRTQDAHRQLEGLWYRIQREVYSVPLGMPAEKPNTVMDADRAIGCFAELTQVLELIRTNLRYLKITA